MIALFYFLLYINKGYTKNKIDYLGDFSIFQKILCYIRFITKFNIFSMKMREQANSCVLYSRGLLKMKSIREIKIEKIAKDYLHNLSQESFNELYKLLREEYRRKLDRWINTSRMVDEHEVITIFDDTLLKVIARMRVVEEGDFVKLFAVSINNSFKSLLRKLKTRRTYEMYEGIEDENEENTAMFETIADEFDLEEHVTQKKEADQRELIDFLTDPVKVTDETTMAIVETFLESEKPTPTAIGKVLGLHHSTVIRKIERLANRFDERQFGDYRDYLLA